MKFWKSIPQLSPLQNIYRYTCFQTSVFHIGRHARFLFEITLFEYYKIYFKYFVNCK